ncbi:unnamed protein product [Aphanomyces euteiches]|uniref:Uncharacterized protein n=1 Tax=Aphanomyces euteiches TaxID=100861 RepID=A0A6G0X3Z5_9STRA|nr:hypothetical protein Ae201684_008718 [Aphanomyces euteiches]KAH9085926.1 hypothetical protein Ae201684P_005622 [Aphanomyces euteiches]
MRRALALCVAALAAAPSVGADTCCAVCLNSFLPTKYDPGDWNACREPGGPGCCFCTAVQTLSLPSYSTTMKAGDKQVIKFPGVDKVTFSFVTDNTVAFQHAKPTGTQLEKNSDGNYVVCEDAAGWVYFRGWAADALNTVTCAAVTPEGKIQITAGDGKSSCTGSSGSQSSGGTTAAPTPAPTTTPVVECNAQRGSVIDGKCVCVSDYSGPPNCDGSSSWKLIVSICGGIGAILSIGISIRQIMLFRKKKAEDNEREENAKNESVEVLNVTQNEPDYYDADKVSKPSRRSLASTGGNQYNNTQPSSQPYPVAHANVPSPRQSREYTL